MKLATLRRSLQRHEQIVSYLILLTVMGVMLWAVWPSLNNQGYLAAWDAGGHLLKAYYFAHTLLPLGHLSGWFPIWHGGFDLFQFYPPLLYYLLGPLTLVFKPELALRLFTASLWLGLVPVTYYFLRSFNLNRSIAAIGTSFLLALNASFGVGLGALYGVGLLPNGLGFILAIWVLGRLKRDLSRPERNGRQLLLTGALFGLLLLAHTFSAYWWMLASLLLLATEVVGKRRPTGWILQRYGLVLLTGLLLSAYWWLPLVANLSQMGPTGNIDQTSRLTVFKNLLSAKDSGGWVMLGLAAIGLHYLSLRQLWRTLWLFVGLSVLSLLLALNIVNAYLPFSAVISSSQHIRFEAFLSWLLMALAAFGLAGIWTVLRRIKLPFVAATALAGLSVLIFALVILPTLKVKKGFVAIADNQATAGIGQLATYLDANLRPGEFILTEFNWGARFDFGSPHFVNQRLPIASDKVWDLDGNFPEGTNGAQRPVLIASVLGDTKFLATQQDYLRSRGIRYIVTTQPASKANLTSEPWLRLVWSQDDGLTRDRPSFLHRDALAVFELQDYASAFGLPPVAAAKLGDVTYQPPGRYRLTFSEPVNLPAGQSLALSYHPWLQAAANGQPIAVQGDVESRLTLASDVPGVRSLDITYRLGTISRVGNVISIIALLGIVLLLAKPSLLQGLVKRARSNRLGRGRGRPSSGATASGGRPQQSGGQRPARSSRRYR